MVPKATMISLVVLGSVVASPKVLMAGEPPIPQVLNEGTFEKWRGFIHPSAAELSSERIEWTTTLWAGLTRAQEHKKPLMVWIMNGHPCGLT